MFYSGINMHTFFWQIADFETSDLFNCNTDAKHVPERAQGQNIHPAFDSLLRQRTTAMYSYQHSYQHNQTFAATHLLCLVHAKINQFETRSKAVQISTYFILHLQNKYDFYLKGGFTLFTKNKNRQNT